jgi:soluble lytic murein transglycosylase
MVALASLLLGLGGIAAALHAQGAAGPAAGVSETEANAPAAISAPVTMAPIRSEGDPPTAGQPAALALAPLGQTVLSESDRGWFAQAHSAADRNDWAGARSYAANGTDPIGKRLIEWRYVLSETGGATFQEIADFVYRNPNWPRRDALLSRAERAMPPEFSDPEVIAWYGARKPLTAEGQMRLGQALAATGRAGEGAALIRQAWVESNFTEAEETQILYRYGSLLTEADHRARLDRFLATEGIVDAQRQLARVDEATRRVGQARLQLKLNPTLADSLVSSLDPSVGNDPRFVFDYARALRRFGRDEDAWTALLRLNPGSESLDPTRMWTERHIMARDALKARRYELAYDIVSKHGLKTGGGFADAEFLAGWIALRFLNRADVALTHFDALARGVSLPISRARAHYWTGRAYEALGRRAEAEAAYRRAASDSYTYYGQLAQTHVQSPPLLTLTATLPDIAPVRAAFNIDERVRAMRVLADLGQLTQLRIFAMQLANESENAGTLSLVADLMAGYGDRTSALRIAKLASYKDVVLQPHLAPIVNLPAPPNGVNVEPALVLGLSRQESEFDEKAISSAGARGMMQLMPGTANRTARNYGIAYRQVNLFDQNYNMRLGMAHLNDLLREWSGSYILTIASYNAGGGNVENWVRDFGDPRSSAVDPIDWVELIPFSETRNYVQRVLENTQVYRNRLAGRDQILALRADLHRPNASPPVTLVSAGTTGAVIPAAAQ